MIKQLFKYKLFFSILLIYLYHCIQIFMTYTIIIHYYIGYYAFMTTLCLSSFFIIIIIIIDNNFNVYIIHFNILKFDILINSRTSKNFGATNGKIIIISLLSLLSL